ncbi:MAG: hypothetical protein K2O68_06480, partial [Mucispirillum sp.]|nr:hypothetical protein [Mucispirillum sp.]
MKSKGQANFEDFTSEFNMRNFLITSLIAYTVNTCYAVTVTDVDTDNLKVSVKPLISQRDADNNKIELPEIFNVPYFRYGAGNCAVKLDPQPGDIGVFIVFKSDSNNIKKGDSSQIMPDTFINFPLYSGVYIGGILMNEPENYIEIKDNTITIQANSNVVMNCQNAEVNADNQVNINATNINLGENASLALVNESITD